MPDTSKLIGQDVAIWEGLKQLSRLPGWLVEGRSPERICAVLSQVIPEFNSGEWVLRRCDTGHMLFKEGQGTWTGHYDLYAVKPEGDVEQVFMLRGNIYPPGVIPNGKASVSGALGSADWQAVLPQLQLELSTRAPETVLDSLAFLTDAEEARKYLEQHIRGGSPAYHGFTIQTCQPRIVRYKPGSRCTIVYRLGYSPGYPPGAEGQNWPELVIAKTYRGEKGQNAYDSMAALWKSALGKSSLKLAEPLAYDPERRILIQGPIREEQTLREQIIATIRAGWGGPALEALNENLRKTARGLADLHQSKVLMGREWTWADEIGEVQKRIDRLATVLPHLAQAAEPLMQRLSQLEAASPPGLLVPSHGTFRPAQVLLYQGEAGFIDFDSFCQSEQANDLGLFLCALMRAGLDSSGFEDDDEAEDGQSEALSPIDDTTRQARFEMVCALSETFLAEYERHLPVNRQRVALWAALDVMMLVTHGWIKIKLNELSDILFLLEQYLVENNFVGAA